jgi:hypothetical protein
MEEGKVKWCPECKKDRLIEDFDTNTSRSDGLQSHCRSCYSDYHHSWYEKNKDKVKERVARRNRVLKTLVVNFIRAYLLSHPCADCKFADIRALDFDHVRGEKKFNVNVMVRNRLSLEAIKAEIEKCDVRCRNCHAIRTNSINGSWRNKV